MNFDLFYNNLNTSQKFVVDTIDGTLLVNAGPGTGKTQTIAIRVANILQKTDVLPGNILCLTFTDSGAFNMKERLGKFIGNEALKVKIHTFHSFSTELINRNPELFFSGHPFTVVDKLVTFEIFDNIFKNLPLDNLFSNYHPELGYTYFKSAMDCIGNLKKAGLGPHEFQKIIDFNIKYLTQIQSEIVPFLPKIAGKLEPKGLEELQIFYDLMEGFENPFLDDNLLKSTFQTETLINYIKHNCNYHQELLEKTKDALFKCRKSNKVTPFTADYLKKNFIKNEKNEYILIDLDSKNIAKNQMVSSVYQQFCDEMYRGGYYDFNDMLLELIKVIENPDNISFKLDLQETYQYILIDEFQDTNGVQLRIIENLIDNELTKDNPNLMVVGDTDQAIFKFQGAKIGNLEKFFERFNTVCNRVDMNVNYRSNQEILDFATGVIQQNENRIPKEKLISGKV